MDLEKLNIALSVPLVVGGLVVALVGLVWLPFRFRRPLIPLSVLVLGLLVAGAPSAISRLFPIDLGPRDKMVNNDRHLTLTGWDRTSYDVLRDKTDTVQLQMANPDVTDQTLQLLKGFDRLKVLDLNDTKVTDQGLKVIGSLPTLETIFLERTGVTDAGAKECLLNHPTLRVYWLRSTKVTPEMADEIKAAKPGRRVMVDRPATKGS